MGFYQGRGPVRQVQNTSRLCSSRNLRPSEVWIQNLDSSAISETNWGCSHGSSGQYKASHSRQQPKISLDRIARSSYWNVKDLCNDCPIILLARDEKLHKNIPFFMLNLSEVFIISSTNPSNKNCSVSSWCNGYPIMYACPLFVLFC